MRRAAVSTAAAALVVAGSAGAMPYWTGQRLVGGGLVVGPELALNASGRGLAVWDDETGPDCAQDPASLSCIHTVIARDKPGPGAFWAGSHVLAKPGVGSRPRAAIDPAGDAAVLWVHDIGRDRVVQATIRHGADGEFPNPEDLSKEVLEVRSNHVGLDAAGNAIAVWAERIAGTFQVRAAVRLAALGYWGSARLLSTGAVTGGPALAVDSAGEVEVVWVEGGVVNGVRGDLSADRLEPAVRLSNESGSAEGDPVVAVNDAGQAVAAWQWDDRSIGGVVVHAAYRAPGAAWGVPTALGTAAAGAGGAPQAAIAGNGDAFAVWLGGVSELDAATRPAAAGVWRRLVRLAPGAAREPQVAADARGDAVAAWIDSAATRVKASVSLAGAAAWQPPVTLSEASSAGPRLAADAAGGAVTLWSQRTSSGVAAWGADLLGGWTPTLQNTRPPTVSGTPRPGRSLTCRPGEWEGTVPIRYAYAWLRNGQPIRGAGRARYTVRRVDRGRLVACRVTATNPAGPVSATSRAVRIRR